MFKHISFFFIFFFLLTQVTANRKSSFEHFDKKHGVLYTNYYYNDDTVIDAFGLSTKNYYEYMEDLNYDKVVDRRKVEKGKIELEYSNVKRNKYSILKVLYRGKRKIYELSYKLKNNKYRLSNILLRDYHLLYNMFGEMGDDEEENTDEVKGEVLKQSAQEEKECIDNSKKPYGELLNELKKNEEKQAKQEIAKALDDSCRNDKDREKIVNAIFDLKQGLEVGLILKCLKSILKPEKIKQIYDRLNNDINFHKQLISCVQEPKYYFGNFNEKTKRITLNTHPTLQNNEDGYKRTILEELWHLTTRNQHENKEFQKFDETESVMLCCASAGAVKGYEKERKAEACKNAACYHQGIKCKAGLSNTIQSNSKAVELKYTKAAYSKFNLGLKNRLLKLMKQKSLTLDEALYLMHLRELLRKRSGYIIENVSSSNLALLEDVYAKIPTSVVSKYEPKVKHFVGLAGDKRLAYLMNNKELNILVGDAKNIYRSTHVVVMQETIEESAAIKESAVYEIDASDSKAYNIVERKNFFRNFRNTQNYLARMGKTIDNITKKVEKSLGAIIPVAHAAERIASDSNSSGKSKFSKNSPAYKTVERRKKVKSKFSSFRKTRTKKVNKSSGVELKHVGGTSVVNSASNSTSSSVAREVSSVKSKSASSKSSQSSVRLSKNIIEKIKSGKQISRVEYLLLNDYLQSRKNKAQFQRALARENIGFIQDGVVYGKKAKAKKKYVIKSQKGSINIKISGF